MLRPLLPPPLLLLQPSRVLAGRGAPDQRPPPGAAVSGRLPAAHRRGAAQPAVPGRRRRGGGSGRGCVCAWPPPHGARRRTRRRLPCIALHPPCIAPAPAAAPAGASLLPALSVLRFSSVPLLCDETLRLAGRAHPALRCLTLAACGGISGSGLHRAEAEALGAPPSTAMYAALEQLTLEHCESVVG